MEPTELTAVEGQDRLQERGLSRTDLGKFFRVRVVGSDQVGQGMMTGNEEALVFLGEEGVRREVASASESGSNASIGDLFPHWNDTNVDAAAVIFRLRQAHSDVEKMVLLAPDIGIELAHLKALAESALFESLQRAGFNPALYSAISSSAWALRNADIDQCSGARLTVLASVLLELRESPYLDFSRAADLVEDLKGAGWNVEAPAARAFRAALELDQEDAEDFRLKQ